MKNMAKVLDYVFYEGVAVGQKGGSYCKRT